SQHAHPLLQREGSIDLFLFYTKNHSYCSVGRRYDNRFVPLAHTRELLLLIYFCVLPTSTDRRRKQSIYSWLPQAYTFDKQRHLWLNTLLLLGSKLPIHREFPCFL